MDHRAMGMCFEQDDIILHEIHKRIIANKLH